MSAPDAEGPDQIRFQRDSYLADLRRIESERDDLFAEVERLRSELGVVEETPDVDESVEDSTGAVEIVEEGDAADAEAQQYLEDLQRVTAEFANYRRQAEKRNAEAADRSAISLIDSLLPVLDACDQAIDLGSSDVEPIASALTQVLERDGLERIDALGAVFDPQHHDAVMREEARPPEDDADEAPAETVVVEVMRAGYLFKGAVVRAAMVKVRG